LLDRRRSGVLAALALFAVTLALTPVHSWAGQERDGRPPLSETEKTGKRLFLQRCSFCHLGMPTKYQTYAPVLHNEIIESLGDNAVKEKIMDGSVAMPGFKYTLKEGDVNCIVAYLKTVKKEDVTHKPAKE
jgi:mono/diheme cytochrome c family protein